MTTPGRGERRPDPLRPWAVEVVDGFTHYLRAGESGSGERAPVLLLNGCALPAAGWMPVIESLRGHDLLAMDRPGFAGTVWDGRMPGLASEVAAVQRLIAGPGGGRAPILVAHSMASFRAEALARLRPELVAGIVLVDPSLETYSDRGLTSRFISASWLHHLSLIMSETAIRELSATLLHRGFLGQIGPGRELDRDVFKDPYAQPETIKSAFAEWLSYHGQAADLTSLRASTPPVPRPTSAIFATEDPSPSRLRALSGGFADLTLGGVGDSGHLMMIDRPDVIIRAVADMALRERGLSGPRP